MSTTTLSDRMAAALNPPPSRGAFFAALSAANAAVSDASLNALIASAAGTPDTFASCVCGSEYVAYDHAIVLDEDEIESAASALGDHYGGVPSDVYRFHVEVVVTAVNAIRDRRQFREEDDWRVDHEACSVAWDLLGMDGAQA